MNILILRHKTYAMFKRYNRIDRKDRMEAMRQMERLNDTYMTPAGAGQIAR
jgi:hypothetical protein